MTSATASSIPQPRPGTPPSVVIAGLLNDGSARSVATASVDYALAHGMTVSFVHVVAADARRPGVDDAGDPTFAAVLRAMRGHGRLRCGFEVVSGDPSEVLVARSHEAGLLVIGGDDASPDSPVARYCHLHAGCQVLTVDVRGVRQKTLSTLVTTSA